MPHDLRNTPLKVGDRVSVPCVITAIQQGEEMCNLTVQTLHPMFPSTNLSSMALNTKQVVKRLDTYDGTDDGSGGKNDPPPGPPGGGG